MWSKPISFPGSFCGELVQSKLDEEPMKGLDNDLTGIAITFHQGTFDSIPLLGDCQSKRKCCTCDFLGDVLIVGQQCSSASSGFGVLAYLYFLP